MNITPRSRDSHLRRGFLFAKDLLAIQPTTKISEVIAVIG